ncbi:MAG: glycosyltransferase family 9 protein [Planctomycetota bacterium]
MSICELLISVDMGLIHLGVAVDAACAEPYSPIYSGLRVHPGLDRAMISTEAQCCGCFHWYDGEVKNCPKGHHECMRLITVESVVFAVSKVLSSSRGALGFSSSFLSGSSCH